MRISILAVIAACVAVSGCAGAGKAGGSETVSKAVYAAKNFDWGSDTRQAFAYRVKEMDGKIALCGAWSISSKDRVSEEFGRQAMQSIEVYYGGDRLFSSIGYFNQTSGDLDGATAACRISDIAAPKNLGNEKIGFKATRTSFQTVG